MTQPHDAREYRTLRVRFDANVCFLQLYRPESENTINDTMVNECLEVLDECQSRVSLVVLEGLPEVFSLGADFQEMVRKADSLPDPARLYDVWLKLAQGSFVSVAHVQGRANAGGVGFVAACDIVIGSANTQLSLSELLFGFMPACVMPFLARRVGMSRAHYMTLMTQPVSAAQAAAWGLIDVVGDDSSSLLRKHLLRLRHLSKTSVARYKNYVGTVSGLLVNAREAALQANREVFSDPENLRNVERFVRSGRFPWQADAT